VLKASLDHTKEAAPQAGVLARASGFTCFARLSSARQAFCLPAACHRSKRYRVASGRAGLNATFVFPTVCRDTAA
jgi:hypothetical protein